MLTDTHAHLYYPELLGSIDKIIDNARSSGIDKIIVPAVDLLTSFQIVELSQKHKEIYCAIGIHPCDAKKAKPGDIEKISDLLGTDKVVAVGETGLDYYWDKSNIELQKDLFRQQIRLAHEHSLPVVVHTRESTDDAIRVILEESEKFPVKSHFHCFSGDVVQLANCLSLTNSVVSFCGNITYKNSVLDEVVRQTPLDRMLSETDSPFLPPVPYRGKRNEPAHMTHTITKISELKDLQYEDLAAVLSKNAVQFFDL